MKISDFKNEEALDLLCDILEPTAKILSDTAVANAFKTKSKMEAIRLSVKNHKKEVIEILARLDNTPVEEYTCNLITITTSLLSILNDEELTSFFTSQAQSMGEISGIDATDNTKVKEK